MRGDEGSRKAARDRPGRGDKPGKLAMAVCLFVWGAFIGTLKMNKAFRFVFFTRADKA